MLTYQIPICLQSDGLVGRGGICLSRVSFDDLNAKACSFLHAKEKEFLLSLTHIKRRESYLLGRYCAKHAIGAYLKNDLFSSVLIEGGIFNQPIIYHPGCNNIQLSISHTNNLGAAIAFPETHPMAIDVETICLDHLTTIKTQITSSEQKFVSVFSNSEIKSLTLLWTAKEALSKVLKCGLTLSLELLEIGEIIPCDHFFLIHFKNFIQYQALSFQIANGMCSIVYPKKTRLDLDVFQIKNKLNSMIDN